MANITNRHNLPEAFRRFELSTPHTSEGAQFTVTTLIDSPRVHRLKKKHAEEITEDIADRVWALLGTAVHKVLEVGATDDQIVEQRYHATVNGVTVSGQIDLQTPVSNGMLLSDYKTVRAYALQANPEGKKSYAQQLNLYASLARRNGVKVAGLEVVAICRDWTMAAAKRSETYPKAAIVRIPVDLWDADMADEYFSQRVAAHTRDETKHCTDEEMWAKPIVYAVHERTSNGLKKRAKKLFDNQTDAEIYINAGSNLALSVREQEFVRCADYCSVSQYCDQYQSRRKNG